MDVHRPRAAFVARAPYARQEHVPPKDAAAEWNERKPWHRRQKPGEAEMSGEAAAGGTHTAISK